MSIFDDREPRVTVHISPYVAWQGRISEMPAPIAAIHRAALLAARDEPRPPCLLSGAGTCRG